MAGFLLTYAVNLLVKHCVSFPESHYYNTRNWASICTGLCSCLCMIISRISVALICKTSEIYCQVYLLFRGICNNWSSPKKDMCFSISLPTADIIFHFPFFPISWRYMGISYINNTFFITCEVEVFMWLLTSAFQLWAYLAIYIFCLFFMSKSVAYL